MKQFWLWSHNHNDLVVCHNFDFSSLSSKPSVIILTCISHNFHSISKVWLSMSEFPKTCLLCEANALLIERESHIYIELLQVLSRRDDLDFTKQNFVDLQWSVSLTYWLSSISCRALISRRAWFGIPSSSLRRATFFKATVSPVWK